MMKPTALRTVGVPTANATLPRLVAKWRRDMLALGRSRRTVEERLACVRLFATHAGIDDRPQDGTEDQVFEWLQDQTHWSAATRHTRFSQLKAWFRWLVVKEIIEASPMDRIETPPRPGGSPHPFTPEHMRRIYATPMRRRTRVKVLLAVCQGLRVHEIAKVRGEEIDLIGKTITVTGKGAKKEVLPLHPLVAAEAARMPVYGWWFPSYSREGEHVTRGSVSDTVRKVCRRAGIRAGSAHWMRHTYGTELLDQGAELLVVKELMRHAQASTTQRYVKVADRRGRAAIEALDPFGGTLAQNVRHLNVNTTRHYQESA